MDIHRPTTCRILAILIQNIHPDDRTQFIEDAKQAPDIEVFIKGMGQYKTVSDGMASPGQE